MDNDNEELRTEVKTDVEFDGEGTVYAVKTVQQGKRRVDSKMGHIDGTFSEGTDYYYDGELFYTTGFYKVPENAPSGRYKDDTFHELLDGDISFDDDRMIRTGEYDLEGVDTSEWAKERLEGATFPQELLHDTWLETAEEHLDREVK